MLRSSVIAFSLCRFRANKSIEINIYLLKHTHFRTQGNNITRQIMAKKIECAPLNAFTCDLCTKTFKTKATLRYHLFSHNPDSGTYKCRIDNCQRLFKNPKRLSDHKRRYHLNTENYVCEYCGYNTRIKSNLTVHLRQHTGEKPYCCEYCALSFPSSYQLNRHRDIHNTKRKYYCIVCGESFTDSLTLGHHKALHGQERKFICKICHKSYQQSAGLSCHMRKHKEQKGRCF